MAEDLILDDPDLATLIVSIGIGFRTYDPSPYGQRFLMITEDQNATVASMVVVWSEELKRRVPMK